MIFTPGSLCETWDERDCAGEEHSKILSFPAWVEGEEGAQRSSSSALSWVGRAQFPWHGSFLNTGLAAAKLFLTCSACDMPQHAAIKLLGCPMHSDTVCHPLLSFFW